MNSKERVISTLNKEAVDRVPLDCWVYQKKAGPENGRGLWNPR